MTTTENLYNAIRDGDHSLIVAMIEASPELASSVDQDGRTPLHIAAQFNDPYLGQLFLRAGADPRQKMGDSGHTPMSWAITVGSFEFALELIRLGVEPDLFCAAGVGNLDLTRSFWLEGKLKTQSSYTGSSRFDDTGNRLPRPPDSETELIGDALAFACRGGFQDVATFLLEKGADVNFRGYIGGTALHWAEYSGNPQLCALLRDKGASDELLDFEFKANPRAFGIVVTAAWGLNFRLERLLDRYPDRINIRCEYGTPLNAAVWNGQSHSAQLLLNRGADPKLKNKAVLTALEVAKFKQFPDIVALLEAVS